MGWTRKAQKQSPRKTVASELHSIYHNLGNEGAYNNNPKTLRDLVRARGFPAANVQDVKDFLTTEQSYTVHRRFNKVQFPRRHIRINAAGVRVDIDLIELGDLKQWNDGHSFILTAIDGFSKFIWALPIKRKESAQCAEAFEDMVRNGRLHAALLYSDAGKEFLGSPFQEVLRKHKMQHRICTSEDFHCPFVERAIRTLKEKMFQAMTSRFTRRWIDLLPRVVETYNRTQHSTTKMRPLNAAKDENTLQVYENTLKRYPKDVKRKIYKFKKGDLVRIYKGGHGALGNKGYLPQYTWEVFRIAKLANDRPGIDGKYAPPAYVLEDLHGEVIENALFYENELSRVSASQLNDAYPIREILKQKRDRDGVEWVQVWWQGGKKNDAQWIEKRRLLEGKSI